MPWSITIEPGSRQRASWPLSKDAMCIGGAPRGDRFCCRVWRLDSRLRTEKGRSALRNDDPELRELLIERAARDAETDRRPTHVALLDAKDRLDVPALELHQ